MPKKADRVAKSHMYVAICIYTIKYCILKNFGSNKPCTQNTFGGEYIGRLGIYILPKVSRLNYGGLIISHQICQSSLVHVTVSLVYFATKIHPLW